MSTFLIAIATALTLAWVPVFLKFFKAWRGRNNPISLAICGLVAVCAYLDATVALLLNVSVYWVVGMLITVHVVACVHFYLSFYWAKKRFNDERS